jgi:hypothetical protein
MTAMDDENKLPSDDRPSEGDQTVEDETSLQNVPPDAEVAASVSSVSRLLDAIDKQNKRNNEIRDAVSSVDWAFIRGTGLGLARHRTEGWVQSWELGDANEG